jgi:putative transposase
MSRAGKVKRRMQLLRFGKFTDRLVQTASDYPEAVVLRLSEAYTSVTCGLCGEHNKQVGASKKFNCPAYGARIDRDVNGARNIYLRSLMTLDV